MIFSELVTKGFLNSSYLGNLYNSTKVTKIPQGYGLYSRRWIIFLKIIKKKFLP